MTYQDRIIPFDRATRRAIAKRKDVLGENAKKVIEFQKRADYDIEALAKSLGVLVFDHPMPSDLGGFLYPGRSSSGWVIYVRPGLDADVRRWVIAHELSHWILDKECKAPTLDDDEVHPCFLHGGPARRDRYSRLRVKIDADRVIVFEHPFIDVEATLESERRADWFAGSLLLPRPLLARARSQGWSAEHLADVACVPSGVAKRQMDIYAELRVAPPRRRPVVGGRQKMRSDASRYMSSGR